MTEGKIRKANEQGDLSYHPDGKVTLYCPPVQRQKWGDRQILPRTNYSDLFFDLFYVALAYNAANVINQEPTWRGLMYFIAVFSCACDLWLAKTIYDARFAIGDDLFHRLGEIGVFVLTGTVILHIRSVDVLSNPRDHIEMFVLSLTLALVQFCGMIFYVETAINGLGQKDVLKIVAKRDLQHQIIPFVLFSAASAISGYHYYGDFSEDTTDEHRVLAGSTDSHSEKDAFQTDIPIILCLAASLVGMMYYVVMIHCYPSNGDHKKTTIPLNIDFMIHRMGEWIMLMIGESILSILIVDVGDNEDYFVTYYCGIFTVILLHYYHFRSQPHSADQHAMRRDKNAGVWFGICFRFYSAALVLVGASYKLFLTDVSTSERRLEESLVMNEERMLAGAPSDVDPEVRQQQAAHLFCGAMTAVWCLSDIILVLHSGLDKIHGKCQCSTTSKKGYGLGLVRFLSLVWMGTLSQYTTDPQALALYGFVGIILQLVLRKIGGLFFPEDEHHGHHAEGEDDEPTGEEYKWPNATHAVALHDRSLKEKELQEKLKAAEADES